VTVSVSAFDAQAAQTGMYERGEAAPPLDGSLPDHGARAALDAPAAGHPEHRHHRWFSFEVTEPGLVLVEAVTNGMGDPSLVLFDDFGREIAYNDDTAASLDSLLPLG
jgi:hypothetical protein